MTVKTTEHFTEGQQVADVPGHEEFRRLGKTCMQTDVHWVHILKPHDSY
jgi:hypothetical protein